MYHIIDPVTQEIIGSFVEKNEAEYYMKEWEIADRTLYILDFDDIEDYDTE